MKTDRYSRQTMLPGFGREGQEKLAASRVLVAGAGGLGCAAAIYLAGAGVGHITVADADTVSCTASIRRGCPRHTPPWRGCTPSTGA